MTGTVLSAIEHGSPQGRPIVAVHGLGSTRETWRHIATDGLPERRWICPDLRGHGHSPSGSPPWTIAAHARDVVATLDSLRVQTFDVVGHSAGASTTFELCRQFPERVRSAVLIDPPLKTREEFLPERAAARERQRRWLAREFATIDEMIVESTRNTLSVRPLESLPPDVRPHAYREKAARLERTDTGRFRFRCDPDVCEAIYDGFTGEAPPAVGNYQGRALLLVAGLADLCSTAGRLAVEGELGDRLTVVTVEGACHDMLHSAYPRVLAEVTRFLDQHDRSRA